MSPAREDVRQALYALKRRRWREAYLRWVRGGRLTMRVEPTTPADVHQSIEGEAA